MNINFDIISLTFLSIYLVYRSFSVLPKIDFKNIVGQFIFLFMILVLGCLVGETLYIFDQISQQYFVMIYKLSVAGLFGLVFAHTVLIRIFPYSKQKSKVIWRIPIISMLVGYYFELKYLPIICAGYLLISVLALLVKAKEYRVIYPKILILIIPVIGLFFIDTNLLWTINIVYFLILLLIQNIWELAIVNMKFKIEGSGD